jgi:hypothetical protein
LPKQVSAADRDLDGYKRENAHAKWTYLARRGVVEIPEIPATDFDGNIREADYAVYCDARFSQKAAELVIGPTSWLSTQAPNLTNLRQEFVRPQEIAALLDRGIEETGIADVLEQMRAEDAVRVAQAPDLDLSEVMRTMRDQLR